MPHLILTRRQREIVAPKLRERLRCWFRGGHLLYFNQEFGDLWCLGCAGVWECHSDPFAPA